MVIKVYTSGISGNKEVKKRQQRIMMILDSKNIKYTAIDITEPGKEAEKQFMQDNAKAADSKHPLPPQIFNGQEYCGDYLRFDLANENDELEVFLKLPRSTPAAAPAPPVDNDVAPVINGREHSTEKDTSDPQVPERQNGDINSVTSMETTNGGVQDEEEPSVHGFCYTPGLAKRLEKAMKSRIRKPIPKTVRGYCYTPSLAQRLMNAISKSVRRKDLVQSNNVENENMEQEKQETESVENEEEENLIEDSANNEDNNTIANTIEEGE